MGWKSESVSSPFTFLRLDIPPCPLFRDSQGGMIVPQIPIFEVLKKFDGVTLTDQVASNKGHVRKQYRIKVLPEYLIFHLNRYDVIVCFYL